MPKTKPRIIRDYCLVCDQFTNVARDGHTLRGICAHCCGKLLQAFRLEWETPQRKLWASPAVLRDLRKEREGK